MSHETQQLHWSKAEFVHLLPATTTKP